ncbi:MAG: thioredoxin family protein [Planctomycetes bacterium]|nr:thioredoxin family protein [Planctomycetota bacterium]
MSDAETTTNDRSDAKGPPSARDRLIKAGFLVVALGVVGWAVVKPHLTLPLDGWSDDLPAALSQAKAEGRRVVVIMYDNPQNHTYKNRLRDVVSKDGNREAMDAANMLRVQARVKKDHPLAQRFGVTGFPTTLLLSPDGEVITRWVGTIGEVAFRAEFLQGQPQR